MASVATDSQFSFAVVLDFEATCDEKKTPDPQEVIEFPSVLVNLSTLQIVDEFQSFVRPVHHPQLTPFCTDLTSITQADVAEAPVFADVLARHLAWLDHHQLTHENAVLVTCGDWDINSMFPAQCRVAKPPVHRIAPIYARWLNIKRLFCNVVKVNRVGGMPAMLQHFKLPLVGRHHRGIDDCRNIAALLLQLVLCGGRKRVIVTGELKPARFPPLRIQVQRGQEIKEVVLSRRAADVLKREAQNLFKAPVNRCYLPDGQQIRESQDLLWLEDGQLIVVEE